MNYTSKHKLSDHLPFKSVFRGAISGETNDWLVSAEASGARTEYTARRDDRRQACVPSAGTDPQKRNGHKKTGAYR